MSKRARRKTGIVTDPTGELHDGIPTYIWNMAPAGYATRRQLSEMGLRKGGQDVAAQVIRRGGLTAYLYEIDKALPKRPFTEAKQRAVQTAARARQRCYGKCGRTDLGYIPRQGAPNYGACDDCMGYPPSPADTEPANVLPHHLVQSVAAALTAAFASYEPPADRAPEDLAWLIASMAEMDGEAARVISWLTQYLMTTPVHPAVPSFFAQLGIGCAAIGDRNMAAARAYEDAQAADLNRSRRPRPGESAFNV